jgi:hypothetical protein
LNDLQRAVDSRRRAGRRSQRVLVPTALLIAGAVLVLGSSAFAAASDSAALPDAPQPQTKKKPAFPEAGPCQIRNEGAVLAMAAIANATQVLGISETSGNQAAQPAPVPCPIYVPIINWYARFLDGPKVKPLTPKEKAWLAVRNVTDPFNAITILGQSAIAIGSDSHSPYGPGMTGFGKSVGVSYTQDITGEFFGTFLIPSIVHQDPHYHRMPDASVKRRIAHAIIQVVWTQGDNGEGMLNYSNLVGFAIADEISNLYVPGRSTNLPASSARYGINLALAPTDNFITEFLPDVASHIHVHEVIVQRIINQVAKTGGPPGS